MVDTRGTAPKLANADFISQSGFAKLDDDEQYAQHDIRHEFMIHAGTTSPVGQVLNVISLDVTIDQTCTDMGKYYEYFTFRDLAIECASTSPAGTSSGGFQICHITDPDNVQFQHSDKTNAASGVFNVHKAVRQQGSLLVRPRESVKLQLDLEGYLYTYKVSQTGTNRFSSFGSVVMVLRDPPAIGDTLSFTVTLVGKMIFARTTISPSAAQSSFSTPEMLNLAVILDDRNVRLILMDAPHLNVSLDRAAINDIECAEKLFFHKGKCVMPRDDFVSWVFGRDVKSLTDASINQACQCMYKITGLMTVEM